MNIFKQKLKNTMKNKKYQKKNLKIGCLKILVLRKNIK